MINQDQPRSSKIIQDQQRSTKINQDQPGPCLVFTFVGHLAWNRPISGTLLSSAPPGDAHHHLDSDRQSSRCITPSHPLSHSLKYILSRHRPSDRKKSQQVYLNAFILSQLLCLLSLSSVDDDRSGVEQHHVWTRCVCNLGDTC